MMFYVVLVPWHTLSQTILQLSQSIKGCTAEIKKPDTEAEKDAQALSEAFFSQLGPNSNFGAQFAQTVTVKCSDAPS